VHPRVELIRNLRKGRCLLPLQTKSMLYVFWMDGGEISADFQHCGVNKIKHDIVIVVLYSPLPWCCCRHSAVFEVHAAAGGGFGMNDSE
jgi:hypothetical protein